MSERKTFPVEMVREGDLLLVERCKSALGAAGPYTYFGEPELHEVREVPPGYVVTLTSVFRTGGDGTDFRIVEMKRDGEWLTDEPTEATFTPDPDELEWPQEGDQYWVVNSRGWPVGYRWGVGEFDRSMKYLGNCYRTHKEAEAAADRVRRAYRGTCCCGGGSCS